jgi:uncharacterized protein (TIGR00106 family)
MLVELTITPLDKVHSGRDIAKVVEILKSTGLSFQVGPMGTCIEGDWVPVIEAIRRCHEAVTQDHERVMTNISIDDRKHYHHSLAEVVKSLSQWHIPPAEVSPSADP